MGFNHVLPDAMLRRRSSEPYEWAVDTQNRDVGIAFHLCHGTFHRYRIDEVVESASCHGLKLVSMHHLNFFIDLESCSVSPETMARLLEKVRSRWITPRLCHNFVVVLRSASDVRVAPGS